MRERKREGRENDTAQSERKRMRKQKNPEQQDQKLANRAIKREGEKNTSARPPSRAFELLPAQFAAEFGVITQILFGKSSRCVPSFLGST